MTFGRASEDMSSDALLTTPFPDDELPVDELPVATPFFSATFTRELPVKL